MDAARIHETLPISANFGLPFEYVLVLITVSPITFPTLTEMPDTDSPIRASSFCFSLRSGTISASIAAIFTSSSFMSADALLISFIDGSAAIFASCSVLACSHGIFPALARTSFAALFF